MITTILTNSSSIAFPGTYFVHRNRYHDPNTIIVLSYIAHEGVLRTRQLCFLMMVYRGRDSQEDPLTQDP